MRDEFLGSVKEILAARVGFQCSNPQCRAPTSGPQLDCNKAINVGVAAHICAASPDGPRYDPNQSPEQRKSAENGIWLCQTCAKLIDSDKAACTPAVLHGMKRQAETAAPLRLGKAGTALGRAHEFSSEEIELLIAAAERGEFIIIGADQIGNWIRAGQSDFVNFDDRETAARYFDAFNALMKSGLAHREAEDYYRSEEHTS